VLLLGVASANTITFVFVAALLGAVVTTFTAVIFVLGLDAFSHHFFFWPHLPCPGPGMLLEVGGLELVLVLIDCLAG
jgi:hypothetical protein